MTTEQIDAPGVHWKALPDDIKYLIIQKAAEQLETPIYAMEINRACTEHLFTHACNLCLAITDSTDRTKAEAAIKNLQKAVKYRNRAIHVRITGNRVSEPLLTALQDAQLHTHVSQLTLLLHTSNPFWLANLQSMKHLYLCGCQIWSLPTGLNHLVCSDSQTANPEQTSIASAKWLCLIGDKRLKTLVVKDCEHLQIGECHDLAYLDLSQSPTLAIASVTSCDALTTLSLSCCPHLQRLIVSNCKCIRSVILPNTSVPLVVKFVECPLLTTINTESCAKLEALRCCYCDALNPLDLSACGELKSLELKWCRSLKQLHLPDVQFHDIDIYACPCFPSVLVGTGMSLIAKPFSYTPRKCKQL